MAGYKPKHLVAIYISYQSNVTRNMSRNVLSYLYKQRNSSRKCKDIDLICGIQCLPSIPQQKTGVQCKEGQAEGPPRKIAVCVESSLVLDRENACYIQAGTVALKICVCAVLHWHLLLNLPPQCCFYVVLSILWRAVLRECFPGFETKCVVNWLFALQCPVCHRSCIFYSVLLWNMQRRFVIIAISVPHMNQ